MRSETNTLHLLLLAAALVPAVLNVSVSILGVVAGYPVLGYAAATAVVLLSAIVAVVLSSRVLLAVLAAESIGLAFLWMVTANRAGEGAITWTFAAGVAMTLMLVGSVLVIPIFLIARRLRKR